MNDEGPFARRLGSLRPSPILSMMNKSREKGQTDLALTPIHLEVGDPDFETPLHIRKKAEESANAGETHYTSARGIPQLREAIAATIKMDYDIGVNPTTEVMISPGSKFAIFCAFMITVNEGDEVLIPEPAWPAYSNEVRMCGGIPRMVPMSEVDYGFELPSADVIEAAITDRTRMIVVNSPNNPSGFVLQKRDMTSLAEILKKRDILLLSDEVYCKFMYDGFEHLTPLASPELREKSIVVNSFSKTYAMTGWRIGYTVAKKELIDKMVLVQESISTCAPVFVQKAGLAALEGPQDCVEEMRREYDLRRKLVVDALSRFDSFGVGIPRGGLYVFPEAKAPGISSVKLAEFLLRRLGISTTPGIGFGPTGEGRLRISLTCPTEKVREAMDRITTTFGSIDWVSLT